MYYDYLEIQYNDTQTVKGSKGIILPFNTYGMLKLRIQNSMGVIHLSASEVIIVS